MAKADSPGSRLLSDRYELLELHATGFGAGRAQLRAAPPYASYSAVRSA